MFTQKFLRLGIARAVVLPRLEKKAAHSADIVGGYHVSINAYHGYAVMYTDKTKGALIDE